MCSFYKSVVRDTVNVLLMTATYNFKKFARYCKGTISRKNVFLRDDYLLCKICLICVSPPRYYDFGITEFIPSSIISTSNPLTG